MKKLMFATALTASAVAFGATDGTPPPFNAISFEGYDLSQHAITNGMEITEDSSESIPTYFFYTNTAAGAEDSSYVTNYLEGTTLPVRPTYFKNLGTANGKYLALDTEGGTLWRYVNTDGSATNIVTDGIYIDTLVQFTVTEDEEPQVETGDKLAIWLQSATNGVGVTETNLMVRAKYWFLNGETQPESIIKNYVIDGVSINPGDWHRLTVKAIKTIVNNEETAGFYMPAFEIFIDGTAVAATEPQIQDGDNSLQAMFGSVYLEGMGDLVAANKLFPTLAEDPGSEADITLQGVGFKGTGAIDDLVLTADPQTLGGPAGVEFTLTWDTGVSAVEYVLSADTATTNSVTSGTAFAIPAGTTGTIEFIPTYDDGYEFGYLDMGEHLNTLTIDVPAESTNATLVAAAIPTYTLTVPNVANATLTSPASLTGIRAGTITLTWTAAPGYTFPNGETTYSKTFTVDSDHLTVDVSDVESALSKQTFTVTVVDIENATVVATTNSIALTDALSENTLTNQYTVATNDTITVTVTPSKGYAYTENTMDFITGDWTLNGNGTISTNVTVTEAITLEVPDPDSRPYELDVICDSSKTTVDTLVNGNPSFNGACIGDTIVITSDPEDGYEYASLPVGWEWDPENAGTIKTNITVDAAFIDTAEGNEASSDYFFGKYTITVPDPTPVSAPSGIEIVAGEQGSTTYATEEAAAAVTNSVTITVPAAVSNALETAGVGTATYTSLFEPKVVSDGNGGYKIAIGLTATAETYLQTQANTDAGTLVSGLDAGTATVATTPGFYYSVKYGSALNAMSYQTAGELATGATKSITLPAKSGTSGFYKVVISIGSSEAVTPAQD